MTWLHSIELLAKRILLNSLSKPGCSQNNITLFPTTVKRALSQVIAQDIEHREGEMVHTQNWNSHILVPLVCEGTLQANKRETYAQMHPHNI